MILLRVNEEVLSTSSLPETGTDMDDADRAAAALQRVEAVIQYRRVARDVEFVVQAEAQREEFDPPVGPFTLSQGYRWENGSWVEIDLDAGPLGFILPRAGTYKLVGTAGDGVAGDQLPLDLREAWRRLYMYLTEMATESGANRRQRIDGLGSFTRHDRYLARALELSGAADLLRRWRAPR